MQEGARRSVLVRNTLSTTTVLLAILLDGKADVRTIILARVLQPLYIVHCAARDARKMHYNNAATVRCTSKQGEDKVLVQVQLQSVDCTV